MNSTWGAQYITALFFSIGMLLPSEATADLFKWKIQLIGPDTYPDGSRSQKSSEFVAEYFPEGEAKKTIKWPSTAKGVEWSCHVKGSTYNEDTGTLYREYKDVICRWGKTKVTSSILAVCIVDKEEGISHATTDDAEMYLTDKNGRKLTVTIQCCTSRKRSPVPQCVSTL